MEFLTPVRVFDDNIGTDFDFYRMGLLMNMEYSLNDKLSFLCSVVLGNYRFSVDDNPKTSTFFSLRFGLGYKLFEQVMLIGEVGFSLRSGYSEDSSYEVNSSEFEDYKINVLNLSFGIRYYFNLS